MPTSTPYITGKEQFLQHDGSDFFWSGIRTSGAHQPLPCQRSASAAASWSQEGRGSPAILMQQILLAPRLLSVFLVGLLPSSLPMQRYGSSLTPALRNGANTG